MLFGKILVYLQRVISCLRTDAGKMMKGLKTITTLMLAAVMMTCCGATARAARHVDRAAMAWMDSVFDVARETQRSKWHYKGEYYFRGTLRLERKNIGIISAPNRRFYRKGGRDLLTEDAGDVEYNKPNLFIRKARHTWGSSPRYSTARGYVMEFFNLDIYGDYLLGDHLLSPLSHRNANCYRYTLDSISGGTAYLSFKRKSKNMQLVDGHFAYDTLRRCVSAITFSGTYNFISFTEEVTMCGGDGDGRLWPERARLRFKYWYYGNVFTGNALYTGTMRRLERDCVTRHEWGNPMNITPRYALALDTTRVVTDSAYIAAIRPEPLTEEERALYAAGAPQPKPQPHRPDTIASADTIAHHQPAAPQPSSTTPQWVKSIGNVGEFLFHDHDIINTPVNCLKVKSPNLGYSGSRGVSYRQDVEYVRRLSGQRRWSLTPRVGYFFKTSELTGRLRGELLFSPLHNGLITLEAGMHNVSTSNLTDGSQKYADGTEIDALDFRDIYLNAGISREIANGIDLYAGIVAHHRTPRLYAKEHKGELQLKKRYRDFAPRLTVTYTPAQRYYIANGRKVRVYSPWPTICLDYERGVSGFFGSTNNYEKWESTVSGSQRLTPHHRLIWKAGGGMFTKREDNEFVQYEYFNSGITAYDWDDDRSGVFQLLDRKHYNNSYHYLRGHLVLESPMLILGRLNTRVIRSERLYLNALVTEGLAPYGELGYGLSNSILDISVFASYLKAEGFGTEVKFSLHIFD